MKPKIRGETWRSDLLREGITYVHPTDVLTLLNTHPNIIPCSRCSKTKPTKIGKGVPKELYISRPNLRFYTWCERMGYKYMILSDKYGAHFWDEELEFYDIHPMELTNADFHHLAVLIKNKTTNRGYSGFLFYYNSPLMSVPYFHMMLLTGLDVFFCSTLPKTNIKGFGL